MSASQALRRRRGRFRARGMTLIEMMISIAILGTLLLVFLTTVNRSYDSKEQVEAYFRLRSGALNAMSMMREDLRRAGFATSGGDDYPLLYQGADAGDDFPDFVHMEPAELFDLDGEVPNNDIVFLIPQDADGDGWPDTLADGTPDWSPDPIAFLLSPDGQGTNVLRRVDSGGGTSTIARGVLWVDFDTPTSSGFDVPLGCLRVRLALAEMEGDNVLESYEHEMTLRLQNGGLL